jgi:hypothetical protein
LKYSIPGKQVKGEKGGAAARRGVSPFCFSLKNAGGADRMKKRVMGREKVVTGIADCGLNKKGG